MNLKSNNYPTIEYEKGEEIFLSPEEINSSFYFDVEEELTSNDEAMAIVASMIDYRMREMNTMALLHILWNFIEMKWMLIRYWSCFLQVMLIQ